MTTRNIRSPETGQLYMQRSYLWGAPYMIDGSTPFDEHGAVREDAERTTGTQCFKHKIVTSDFRGAIHNHPWDWGTSLILWGGYIEERFFESFKDAAQFMVKHETIDLCGYGDGKLVAIGKIFVEKKPLGWIVRHRVRAGQLVHLDHSTFHRVDLVNGKPAHTLFLAGPIRSGWGFLEPSGQFIKAQYYLRPKGEVTT